MIAGVSYLTIGLVGGILMALYKPEWIVAAKQWVKDRFTDVSKF